MANNQRANDQRGDYARIPAQPLQDESSYVGLPRNCEGITISSSLSSEVGMKSTIFSANLRSITPEKSLSPSPPTEAEMKNKNLFKTCYGNQAIYEIEPKKQKKEPGKLRTILKSLRYAKNTDLIILIFCIIIAISLSFVGPIIIYFFVSPGLDIFIKAETQGNLYNITLADEIPKLTHYGYAIFALGGVAFILIMVQTMASEMASRNIMIKIKTAYLAKMLSLEVGWYDKSQEKFVNTVSHDLQKMAAIFDSKMANVAEIVSTIIVSNTFGIIAAWKVAIVVLAMMLFGTIVIYFVLQATKKIDKLRQQFISKCSRIASEVLGNIRTVAAYGGEYIEIQRYKSTLKMTNKYGLKHSTAIAAGKGFSYFVMSCSVSFAYYAVARLFLLDDFKPGWIMVIFITQINSLYACTMLLNTISDFNLATDSAYTVMRFLDTETSYSKSILQGNKPETFNPEVSFRNVQFSYPTNLHTKVLHALTLDIKPGKVTAIVGGSGVGKSTIVNLIMRLYDVNAGQILIGGVDIRDLNVSWLRNQIGVVGQEPTLFDTSIEENIRYGKTTATLEEIIEAAKISYAHGFIEKLPSGYGSIVGERGTKLSAGQKQRIAIARAIVRKPKLLLLDEATSALDFHSEGIIQEALDNAMRGRTTLIIAHRLSTVRKADVIYAMKEGYIVENGTHRELMELKGYYYSLAKVQEHEEKDKAVALYERSVPKELIEETNPLVEEDLEVPRNDKMWSSKTKFKIMVTWLLATFFILITSAFNPISQYVYALVFQSLTHTGEEQSREVLINISYIAGLGVIMFLSLVFSAMMSTIANQLWLEKLQKKNFSKIVSMDISWFDRSGNSPNECLEVLTNSPPLIESVTGDRAAQVLVFLFSLIFAFGFSLYLNINMTLANSPFIMIFFIINGLTIKTRGADAKSASLTTRSTKVATEYVQGVKTIQTLNCQEYVIKQYQDMLVCAKKAAKRSIVMFAVVYGFSVTLLRMLMGTLFTYGAYVVARDKVAGTLLIGDVFVLTAAAAMAGPALIMMTQYPAARQAINRLKRIAYTKTSLNVFSDQGKKPEISGNIVFKDVAFCYPTRKNVQVLKKLNLKIEAGKTVALVGDSGCGKSTIISLLERFYLPNEGQILVDGKDINKINVRHLRSQMGLVLQEPVLFDITIKENIAYGSEEEVSMEKIIEAAKIANIHDIIMKLPQILQYNVNIEQFEMSDNTINIYSEAYETSVGEKGSKLSAGQKQRIAIARAVLRNPKILLLDEATSALDTESEKAVQEALENASIGRTNIVIAHRLSTIRKADKIVVLQSGEVIEEGNHGQLMEKRGHYFNLINR